MISRTRRAITRRVVAGGRERHKARLAVQAAKQELFELRVAQAWRRWNDARASGRQPAVADAEIVNRIGEDLAATVAKGLQGSSLGNFQ